MTVMMNDMGDRWLDSQDKYGLMWDKQHELAIVYLDCVIQGRQVNTSCC